MSSAAGWGALSKITRVHQTCRISSTYGSPCRYLSGTPYLYLDRSQGVKYQEILAKFRDSLTFPKETAHLHQIIETYSPQDVERDIVLHGYLGVRRDVSKSLCFAPVLYTENFHKIQVVSHVKKADRDTAAIQKKFKSLRPNTPVAITGTLRMKPKADRKEGHQNGSPRYNMEVVLRDVQALNEFPSDIIMTPETEFPPEKRHLQIFTSKDIALALNLRDQVAQVCRKLLQQDRGFCEVETPLLFKSTSEGAREFGVPTRRRGMAYALPQSPQQFKQILMASGRRKYFQIARCFRDEDLRADRQPEFTQLDIEAAYSTSEDIMSLVENIVRRIWRDALCIEFPEKLPRLTYDTAMSNYGSDKPDLRIPIQPFTVVDFLLPADLISMISPLKKPIVEAMVLPFTATPDMTRKFIGQFLDSKENRQFLDNYDGGPGIFVYDSSKPMHGLSAFGFEALERIEQDLDLEDGKLIVLQARERIPYSGGSTALGNLRSALYWAAVKHGLFAHPGWRDFRPLWITDFPLFSPQNSEEPGQGGNAGFASTHHPFTAPKTSADDTLLLTDPSKAIAEHYDLVINGEEIGGGSQRIHHAEVQGFIFRDVLKMDEDRISEFSHLLDALRAGCPPHAGIALGFDRLVAMVASCKLEKKLSLRDVIAFPKNGKGEDPMVESPEWISEDYLRTYHLKLRD